MGTTARRKRKEQDPVIKANAIAWLGERVKPGDTVYTVVRHRTRSLCAGVVAVLVLVDGKVKNISNIVSDVLGCEWDDRDGVWTGDEFTVVRQLSQALHPEDKGGGRGVDEEGKMNTCSPVPTPERYESGYSLVHERL